MVPEDEYVQVDEKQIGLDRAIITSKGQIQLPQLGDSQRHDDGPRQDPSRHVELAEPDLRSSTQHMKDSIKQKSHDAGIKIRKTFHISKESDGYETLKPPIIANTAEETSDSRLDSVLPIPDKRTLKEMVHNPVDTVKSKVSNQGSKQMAENIAAKEIAHGQEVDLVNASTAVERADTEDDKLRATQTLSELLKQRQSTYVRWTLDRHVTKVRIIPRDTMFRRPKTDFETKNASGEVIMDWRAYVNHVSATLNTPLSEVSSY